MQVFFVSRLNFANDPMEIRETCAVPRMLSADNGGIGVMDKTETGETGTKHRDTADTRVCGVLEAALAAVTGNGDVPGDTRDRLCARLRTLQAGFCAGRQDCGVCDRGFACRQVVRMLFHANGLPPLEGE